jgi:hypothetical protein
MKVATVRLGNDEVGIGIREMGAATVLIGARGDTAEEWEAGTVKMHIYQMIMIFRRISFAVYQLHA